MTDDITTVMKASKNITDLAIKITIFDAILNTEMAWDSAKISHDEMLQVVQHQWSYGLARRATWGFISTGHNGLDGDELSHFIVHFKSCLRYPGMSTWHMIWD